MDLTEHVLPPVLAQALALHAAGPVDTSPLAERAHLFDANTLGRLRVTGRDRVRFLHAMLSNAVQGLPAGEGVWATFNTVQGRTVSDLRLFVESEDRKEGSVLVLCEPGARDPLVDGLDKFVIAEKVFFEDAPERLWLVAGAGAEDAVAAVAGAMPAPALFAHVPTTIGGAPVRLLRLDRSGPEGDIGILVLPEHEATALGALDLPRGSDLLLEAARLEAGQPRFGIDFGPKSIPLEAGLKDRVISFTKGCYIGQEVICRLDSMGTPSRKLVRLDGMTTPPAPGDDVVVDGKVVGWVTSSGHVGGQPRALAYVKKRHNSPGTAVAVGEQPATVGAEV